MNDQYESNKVPNTRYIWARGDKILILKIQMVISALLIFIGIVQATNIFLLNKAQDNPITSGFFIIVILLVILSGVTIVWAVLNQKRLIISDNANNATNTKFSQILLFVTLLLITSFVVFFTLFKFAKQDLLNSAQASSMDANQSYENSYNNYSMWVNVIGYMNLVLIVLTAFTYEVMTDSRACANLMISLLCSAVLIVSFYLLHAIGVMHSIFSYPSLDIVEWPFSLIKIVALLSVLLTILTVIINMRRKDVSYLLMGSFFLIVVILIIPGCGEVFREYKKVSGYYTTNCAEQLGHVHQSSLTDQGCINKYRYKDNTQKDCGNRFSDCFESIDDLRKLSQESKPFISTVWEESLYPKANSEPRLVGLSQQCCGTVVNIYSRPLLKIAALSVAYVVLTFLLVCFLFKNSTHASQQNELVLSGASKNILLALFIGVLVIGGIFSLASSHPTDIVRRDTIVVNRLISIGHSSPANSYHEFNKCTKFQYFEEESLLDQDYKNIILGEISVAKASNVYCEKCSNPHLLIVIQTVRAVSDNCPTDFSFQYPPDLAKGSLTHPVHIIPSTIAQPLAPESVCFDEATKHSRCVPCNNYIGVAGDPISVLNFIRSSISACNRQGLKFILHSYQIDPTLFNKSDGSSPKSLTISNQSDEIPKKALSHHTNKQIMHGPRVLAAPNSMNKHTVQVNVRDLVSNLPLSSASVNLYESYEGENTCNPGASAKLIFSGETSSLGSIDFDFIFTTLPQGRYTVHVSKHSGYAQNCRTFTLNLKRKFLDVGLSPSLGPHQIRFVLEWGSESTSDLLSDLDLYLTANSVSDNWLCYASYFSSQCAGAIFHGDSTGDQHSTEAITLQNLGQTKYLVFFKLPVVSASNGIVDNSIILQLKPLVKIFTYEQMRPTQVTLFDPSLQKGTLQDYEKNFRFANLAWCVNGVNSEIVKNAQGLTYPVAWQVADPDHSTVYDLPLSSVVC